MAMLVIRHRVKNLGTWRTVFDGDADARHAHGSRSERVFQGLHATDEVLIYCEWDHAKRAHLYARSDEFRDAMVRSGVADRPDVWILQESDRIAF